MKIVPMLEENEYKRERKFYSDRGLPCPKDLALEQESEEKKAAEAEAAMTPDANTNMDFHRYDEQVCRIIAGQTSYLVLTLFENRQILSIHCEFSNKSKDFWVSNCSYPSNILSVYNTDIVHNIWFEWNSTLHEVEKKMKIDHFKEEFLLFSERTGLRIS